MTSSLFLIPIDFSASTKASVPLFVDIQCLAFINLEKDFSNFSTCGPKVNSHERITFFQAFM